MEVTEHVQITPAPLIPLSDGLVDRNVDPADTSAILHGVSVMKANYVAIHIEVCVVTGCDDELHALVASEELLEMVVHVEFKRVALLVSEVRLLSDAGVIACVANDGDVQVGVLQVCLNARVDALFCEHDRINRQQVVTLHQLLVDRAADEVTKQTEHHLLDGGVALGDIQQLDGVRKELRDARIGHLEIEGVETRNLFWPHRLLNVPIGRNDEGSSFRTAVGCRLDDKRLRSLRHPEDGLILTDQSFVVSQNEAELLLGHLDLGTFFHLGAILRDHVTRLDLLDLLASALDVEPPQPMADGISRNTEVFSEFLRRHVSGVCYEELIFLVCPFLHFVSPLVLRPFNSSGFAEERQYLAVLFPCELLKWRNPFLLQNAMTLFTQRNRWSTATEEPLRVDVVPRLPGAIRSAKAPIASVTMLAWSLFFAFEVASKADAVRLLGALTDAPFHSPPPS